eukprot:CAMPEP_0119109960 /NCGR_PEP_ID=MMETSP1180-20130426/25300_1 /TAXON_ID=3052 ORGANISM="Chlamydomonas cf sp, Strain CCMP681" /NCGR_SAMPLE_ID=MMETSP1180 /ASSEMBLY_ACC=CAM_ASM_000741 /LENGTH=260 /DNA_ID=CAMNT_0007096017 /DNA_START=65 /DNA_END=847 /DNA_ORIENTATION=+
MATIAQAAQLEACKVISVLQSKLHVSKPTWWLESRFHFSFADWNDPSRMNWGALRVLNDDLVKGKSGFGTHSHRDAEIFTYVVDGQLSHRDSMGNGEALSRGAVQYLSAGTGISHSEMNDSEATCRFLQVWLTPDKRGRTPQYGSSEYTKADRHNRLLHVLGGSGPKPAWTMHSPHSIKLHQDANVLVSECDAGHSFELELGPGRQAYLVCVEGGTSVNDVKLAARDAAKLISNTNGSTSLKMTALDQGMHLMMIEMAMQ